MLDFYLTQKSELENKIEKIEDKIMKKYGDYPYLFVIFLTTKERTQIRKYRKEIKRLDKKLKALLKCGLHQLKPEINSYKEWSHYAIYLKSFLTKEDLEFEEKLRSQHIKKIRGEKE